MQQRTAIPPKRRQLARTQGVYRDSEWPGCQQRFFMGLVREREKEKETKGKGGRV